MDELEALLILNSLPNIGSMKIRLLLKYYGSAIDALHASADEIATFPGFGPKIIDGWKNRFDNDKTRENLILAERLQTNIISFTNPNYPKRLLEIPDYPLVLYVKGNLLKQDRRSLSIVGTRQGTIYGLEMAKKLSCELAQAGFTVVSGLARGVDTAAHQGALQAPSETGRTLAVLGSGIGSIYPSENRELAQAICERGALISEFPMATPPEKQNFPRRNRIVSGMTMGTILIEAPIKSGAMLTTELALSQRRPLFILPGRADQDSFRGNHALIKGQKGLLIENVEDILKTFDDYSFPLAFNPTRGPLFPLEGEEEELIRKMPSEEISIEELILRVQWPVAKLNGLLMSLVLKKWLKNTPVKFIKKLRWRV